MAGYGWAQACGLRRGFWLHLDGLWASLAQPAASSHLQNIPEAPQRQTYLVIAAHRGVVPEANHEAASRAAHEVASLRFRPAVVLGRAVLGIHHRQERCVGRVPEGCIWGVGQQMGGVPAGRRTGCRICSAHLSAELPAGHDAGRAAASCGNSLGGWSRLQGAYDRQGLGRMLASRHC